MFTNAQAAGILGTGSYLPDRVVTNAEVAEKVGVIPRNGSSRRPRSANAGMPRTRPHLISRCTRLSGHWSGRTCLSIASTIIVSISTPDSGHPESWANAFWL